MYKYIKLIIRYLWVVVLAVALVGGAQYALDKFYVKNVYEAKTTLLVLHKPDPAQTDRTFEENAYQSLLASEMLVQDYKEIIKTGIVMQKMRAELKDQIPWLNTITDTDLYDKITVSVKTDTRIITLTVKDGDAQAAAMITNKIAEIFENQSLQLVGSDYITILDTAQAPESPVTPQPVKDTAMAAAAGLLAGIAIILFIDYIGTQKRTAENSANKSDKEATAGRSAKQGYKSTYFSDRDESEADKTGSRFDSSEIDSITTTNT